MLLYPTEFLEPINLFELSQDQGYSSTQLGSHVKAYVDSFPDIEEADMILVGCPEMRGNGNIQPTLAPDWVRSAFYQLFHWHKNVTIADIGNIKKGATLQDTYAALQTVLKECISMEKKIVIIGGSHDISLAQYGAYKALNSIIEATCIDAFIDLNMNKPLPAHHFLMEMLTSEPNFIKHYNHIGFQSYFVHPQMLETIDKLRFDCFRVGKVKERLEEMEPPIRNSHMLSLDITAIQHAHAPANLLSPNGFTGEEACTLMQYAGMSNHISSIGIYGYDTQLDTHNLTAQQLAHLLWYIMDGIYKGKQEAHLDDKDNFNEFTLAFAEVETIFLQSKKTNRWWMQLPNKKMIACSHLDYVLASNNEIPERWLRAMERE